MDDVSIAGVACCFGGSQQEQKFSSKTSEGGHLLIERAYFSNGSHGGPFAF
jgi:hypothetical protein